MACTTVDCLPPITGREKPLAKFPWVTPLGLGSVENKGLKIAGYVPLLTLVEASDWWKASNCGTSAVNSRRLSVSGCTKIHG